MSSSAQGREVGEDFLWRTCSGAIDNGCIGCVFGPELGAAVTNTQRRSELHGYLYKADSEIAAA